MRFRYKYQADCGTLHKLVRSQSAQCLSSWHSCFNMLGDMVVITIKWKVLNLRGQEKNICWLLQN